MTDLYDDILEASDTDTEAVKDIFSDEEGNLSIDENTMKDIISNCEIITGTCKK